MIKQGLLIAAVGFTCVVGFLSLLYLVLKLFETIVPRFSCLLPDDQPKDPPQEKPAAAVSQDEQIAVAIAAALARKKRKK
ncbi:MAG: OadG family transporter subunit [Kiritimatiellia bacterium]